MDMKERARAWWKWASRLRQTPQGSVEAYEQELSQLPPYTRLLHRDDREYPASLLDLKRPPEFIYWQGKTHPVDGGVAMVGTRHPDAEGERLGKAFASDVAATGISIISGGAIGIDAICHRAAVDCGGHTLVVLPSSIDTASPAVNRPLFVEILRQGGALVSEYPLGTPTRKHFFARRNSLIAALSDVIVVVRAREHGGTHLTVDAARELNRRIVAIPGSPEDPSSRGCLELIRQGCECVWSAEHLGISKQRSLHPSDALVTRVYEFLLQVAEVEIDTVSNALDLPIGAVARAILDLELSGLARREGGMVTARRD